MVDTSSKLPQQQDKKPAKKADSAPSHTPSPQRKAWIIGLSVAAGLLLVAVIALAVAYTIESQSTKDRERSQSQGSGFVFEQRGSGFGRGHAVRTEIDGDTVTTTVYKYLTGVVVKVTNDTIVVAGGGKQTTIQTDRNTTYVAGVKPAVDDTIVVAGTTSDGVITATDIRVAN